MKRPSTPSSAALVMYSCARWIGLRVWKPTTCFQPRSANAARDCGGRQQVGLERLRVLGQVHDPAPGRRGSGRPPRAGPRRRGARRRSCGRPARPRARRRARTPPRPPARRAAGRRARAGPARRRPRPRPSLASVTGMLQASPSASRISSTTRPQSSDPWKPRSGLKPPIASSSRSAACFGAQLDARQRAARARPAASRSVAAREQVDQLASVQGSSSRPQPSRGQSAGAVTRYPGSVTSPRRGAARTRPFPARPSGRRAGPRPASPGRVQCVQPIDG